MRTRTFLVALPLMGLLMLAGALGAQAQAPWYGTWKLNLAKSRFSPGPAPKSQTVKIEPWENGLKGTNDTVTAEGETRHSEVSGKFDARDNPVTGNPNVDTEAFRRANEHTFVIFSKKGGKATTTTRVQVSTDGKTTTATVRGKDAQGQAVNTVAIYDRQ